MQRFAWLPQERPQGKQKARKEVKYMYAALDTHYILQSVAVESLGVFSVSSREFVQNLGSLGGEFPHIQAMTERHTFRYRVSTHSNADWR